MFFLIKNINDYSEDELKNFFYEIPIYKQEKIKKYKSEKEIKMSIIGEIILKELLKKNYNLNYNRLIFKTNKNGKPFIANSNVFFNISHSKEYIIVAISNNPIGVDIEKKRKISNNMIKYITNESEKNYILSSKDFLNTFFKLYVLKEAYIKMLGLNINCIKNIHININNNKYSFNDKNIKVKLINIIDDYEIAIIEKSR